MRGDMKNYGPKYYEAIAYLLGDRKRDALQAIGQLLEENPRNIEAMILKGSL